MLTPKRYQVDPTRGGAGRAGGAGHTTQPTTTTTPPTTSPGATPPPSGPTHGAVAAPGRRLVGMTGGEGTVSAQSPQGRELTQTRNEFKSLTDHASGLVRQAREWAQSNPNDPRIRTNLEAAAHDLSRARGIMQSVRSAYPDQSSLWVKSGNR